MQAPPPVSTVKAALQVAVVPATFCTVKVIVCESDGNVRGIFPLTVLKVPEPILPGAPLLPVEVYGICSSASPVELQRIVSGCPGGPTAGFGSKDTRQDNIGGVMGNVHV